MAYRGNKRLNAEIEKAIGLWRGTIHGVQIEKAYNGDADYETVCEIAGIEYEEFAEE